MNDLIETTVVENMTPQIANSAQGADSYPMLAHFSPVGDSAGEHAVADIFRGELLAHF